MSEEKKVYLVQNQFVYDGEDDCIPKCFSNENAAREYARLLVEEFRENDHLAYPENAENTVIEEVTERHRDVIYSFCAYEDGAYCEDHVCIRVLELPLCNFATDVLGI